MNTGGQRVNNPREGVPYVFLAEERKDRMKHRVLSWDVLLQAGSYTNYFADALIAEAELDSRVVGIHAAMGGGTGMNRFEQRFPERTFDVGIAEQVSARCHAYLPLSALLMCHSSWVS